MAAGHRGVGGASAVAGAFEQELEFCAEIGNEIGVEMIDVGVSGAAAAACARLNNSASASVTPAGKRLLSEIHIDR